MKARGGLSRTLLSVILRGSDHGMRLRGRTPSAPTLRRPRTLLVVALGARGGGGPGGGGGGPPAPAPAAPPHRTAVIVQLADASDPAPESRQAAGSDGQVSHVFA